MAKVCKCTRCGNIYDKESKAWHSCYSNLAVTGSTIKLHVLDAQGDSEPVKMRIDLCPECTMELYDSFMRGEDERI